MPTLVDAAALLAPYALAAAVYYAFVVYPLIVWRRHRRRAA